MHLISDLVPVLLVAAILGFVLSRIGQVPLLGYLIAGMIFRALSPEAGSQADIIAFLGELGIILLLFYLGLELSWRQVAPIAGRSFALAGAAMVIPFLVLHGVLLLFGFPAATALLLAFALSITSTAIGAQVLELRGEMSGRLGQLVIGVNLILDVVAVLVIAVLAAGRGGHAEIGSLLLKIAGFAAALGTVGFLVVPRALDYIHGHPASRMILPVLLICLGVGTALLGSRLGVPVSMGAFLAGGLASEARCRRDLEGYLHPIKELFIAFFFIGIGYRIPAADIVSLIPLALAIAVTLLVIRSLAISVSAYLVGEEGKLAVSLAALLLPVSEFSFLVISEARLTPAAQQELLATACLSMFLTAFLVEPATAASTRISNWAYRTAPSSLQTLVAIVRGALAPTVSPFPPAGNKVRAAFRNFGFTAALVLGLSLAITEGAIYLDRVTPTWADFRLVGMAAVVALLAPVVWIAWKRWRALLLALLGPLKTGPGTERIRLVQRTTRGALDTVGVGLLVLTFLPVLYAFLAGRRVLVIVGVLLVGTVIAFFFRKDVARLHELLEVGMARRPARDAPTGKARDPSSGVEPQPEEERTALQGEERSV